MGTKLMGTLSSRRKRVVFIIAYFDFKFFLCYILIYRSSQRANNQTKIDDGIPKNEILACLAF